MLNRQRRDLVRNSRGKTWQPLGSGVQDTLARPVRKGRRLRLMALFLILAAAALSAFLVEFGKPKRDSGQNLFNPAPILDHQACQLQAKLGEAAPEMVEIPEGEYDVTRLSLSPQVKGFLNAVGLARILVKKPYFMQSRATSQDEFAGYVAHVQSMPDGEEKNRLLVQIGIHWQGAPLRPSAQPTFFGRLFGREKVIPVESISQEAARGYAEWLSDRSGCQLYLPSREEWAAAVMFLHGDSFGGRGPPPRVEAVRRDLLRGVREWSRSPCPGGFYLTGGDEKTGGDVNRLGVEADRGLCMPAMVSIAGFRLVTKSNAATSR
ncbi:MAG: SUMF1/EgtB/PvdO family nonheme iron enzyme [Magnetococcales bacterium]|nr:SUMF1/EgtB/PvdO family nonheme iron enzyme [Magnetococcales bacterium]